MMSNFAKPASIMRLTAAILSPFWLFTPAYAVTWTEIGDAGSLPATAQIPTGSGALTAISGTLSPSTADGQDMYRIYITGGGTFSATTVGGVSFDSELFLFDSTGKGTYANDDVSGQSAPSTLPAGNALTPLVAGYYYLAITQCCSEASSSGGAIFTVAGSANNSVSGPTGAGGGSAISGYTGAFNQSPGGGAYTIFLTGAQISAVSEPNSAALMVFGALSLSGMFATARRRLQ
jgi:hypothetical protein